MKKVFGIVALILTLMGWNSTQAQLITNFGTNSVTVIGVTDYSIITQTDTTMLAISSPTWVGTVDLFDGNLVTAVTLNSPAQISLTTIANLNTPTAGWMSLDFGDAANIYIYYTGYWNQYTEQDGYRTYLMNYTGQSGVGTLSSVTKMGFSSDGDQQVNTTLVSASVVPEPTTMLLLGVGVMSLAARRRLKRRSA